ncbi:MAG: response regulator transcription factor [Anaerosomatales bacterium]|nr:response regulator transcription factor [Anaerosomatales bacterium]
MSTVKVLLMGARRASLEALSLALTIEPRFSVVGVETDPERFPEAGTRCRADVAVVEPESVDTGLVRLFRDACPETRLLLLGEESDPRLLGLFIAGADGFVDRNGRLESLIDAVATLASDGVLLPAFLARLILARLRGLEESYGSVGYDLPRLGERERAVLRGLASGATNKEIAAEAGVSVSTVKNQVSSVLRKLGVANRSEAVARAFRLGLLADEPDGG